MRNNSRLFQSGVIPVNVDIAAVWVVHILIGGERFAVQQETASVLGFSQTQKQTFKRIHVHHLIRTALYFVRIHVVSGTKTLVGDLFVCWCAHLGDSSFDWDSVMFERRIKFWLFVLFFNQFPR